MQPVVQGATVATGLVLLLAAASKVQLLTRDKARWHPLFVGHRYRRRFASQLVLAGLLSDLAIVGGLLIAVRPASVGAVLLIAVYTASAFGWVSDPVGGCECFGVGVLDVGTRIGLLGRNGALMAIAGVSAGSQAHLPMSTVPVVIGIALLASAFGLGAILEARKRKEIARHAE